MDTTPPTPPDRRAVRIEQALRARFEPSALLIHNDSARHAGHGGARTAGPDAGQTHYEVTMRSARFAGLSRVQRSRAVHEALAAELGSGLHALSLRLSAPDEP